MLHYKLFHFVQIHYSNNYVSKLFSRNDRQSEEFTTLLKEKDDQIAQLLEEGNTIQLHAVHVSGLMF